MEIFPLRIRLIRKSSKLSTVKELLATKVNSFLRKRQINSLEPSSQEMTVKDTVTPED